MVNSVPLVEIVEDLENGSRPEGGVSDSGDVFSVGGEHLNDFGGFDFSSVKLISHDFYYQMKRGKVKPDDIIIVKDGATTGKTSFVNEQFPHFPCAINEHVFRLAVNQKVADPRYAFYYLYSPKGNKEILDDFRGATVGGISQDFVNKVFIPLPPLTEQKRIASLLARADRLRALRRTAHELGESLLQSVFLEMFGDPRTNPKGWKVEKVGRHIKNIRYGTGSPPDYFEKGIPFIRATNVKQGTIKPQGMVYISEEDAKNISKCQIKAGNLIVVRSGVNSGDCALIPPEYDGAYAAYDLIVEVPFPTNQFLNTVINSPFGKETIATLSRRAGQPHVNSEQIESMEFPFPPLSKQEEFAGVVARVELLRGRMGESTRQVENLFESLLNEAFAHGQIPMAFGQIAESNNVNKLIYRCFENLPEIEQRKFVTKFRDQPHNQSQIMHTLAELVCGAYLSSLGYQVVHEFRLNGKTPDWCFVDDKKIPQAFIDATTIHIDKETDDNIERQLRAKGMATYWMNGKSNNVDRLYTAIQKKAVEYRELSDSLVLPFVIAVHSDFRLQFDPEEILSCLLPDEYGIFMLYPHVSGLLFFEDHGAQYTFRYFENSKGVRKFNLRDGLYP